MDQKIKLIIWDFSRTLVFPKDDAYKGSINELYEKQKDKTFGDLFYINIELFRFIEEIGEKVISIIFTTGYVQDDPNINEILLDKFFSIENVESIGFSKSDPKAYSEICKKYLVQPDEVLFIDDQEVNISAANQLGIKVMQYKGDNQEIIQFIKQNLE